jgi:hypothetical protein
LAIAMGGIWSHLSRDSSRCPFFEDFPIILIFPPSHQ